MHFDAAEKYELTIKIRRKYTLNFTIGEMPITPFVVGAVAAACCMKIHRSIRNERTKERNLFLVSLFGHHMSRGRPEY